MADLTSPATVRLVHLPRRRSLGAAHDRTPDAHRELVIIERHGASTGWGECSALNRPGYTAEWAAGAYKQLAAGDLGDRARSPMVAAAVEMAELDARLRLRSASLADELGTAGRSAPAGAVVGLGSIPAMLEQVAALVDAGYGRIKCKVEPGRLAEPVRAILSSWPELEVQLDANGSLGADDLGVLAALRDLGIRAVEQPFPVGDHGLAARLVADTDLVVLADEAVRTVDDVYELARDQAATGVVVKPPCVGGLAAALELLDVVTEVGMHAAIGGMLESGLGRHALAALAPLAAFTVTGDLSPARSWLAEDPFADIELVEGRIAAPTAAGIAPPPDRALLDQFTVASVDIDLEAPADA